MGATSIEEPWLVDHHCHGVVLRDLDRAAFEALMSEAARPSPLGTTLFDSAEGLAIRRWCAPVLDLAALASPDEYLARRLELGGDEVARRFLRSSATDTFLVDTGYLPDAITRPAHLADLAGATAREIVRLETTAQDLLAQGVRPADLPERIVETLAATTAVGAKSIAAYRVGLELPRSKPSTDEVVLALEDLSPETDGSFRIADPVVNGWLAWLAIEAGLPLQFHCGYGDNDLDLHEYDPLLLTDFLRGTQEHGVPVLLLHNYPFHRNAGYLAQVFDHVFMDVGLAVHNSGVLSSAVVRESLEIAPFGKVLYSSDAYGLPELYFLASTLFRRHLDAILGELVEQGDATRDDASRIRSMIGRDNATRAYRLDLDSA